jgi:SAM-dependent methyltransferase
MKTLHAFGDEWRRFPEILKVHEGIFAWYFEGPEAVRWQGLKVLDAGCGMGRWLHFAEKAGAALVGMDVSPAIDVAAERSGGRADFVQADLRWAPFAPEAFDLVYSLGVVHHLEVPLEGVRSLARLARRGGELRLYVYRSLADDPWPRRALLRAVTLLRRITTRLPFTAVHAVAWTIAALATVLFLLPRRLLRHSAGGDRITRALPLVQYVEVPFRMLVAEQFDRLCAPIEGRYRREEVAAWLEAAGLQVRALLPGLGWRAIGVRPPA